MELKVKAFGSENDAGQITVSDLIFGTEYNEGLIHQIVTSYLTCGRAGTKAQKTRAEVRGGGAKPWRQKGTGRARAGSSRSPLWRKGGVIFAAKPKDYAAQVKVNKKMLKVAKRSILSELVRQDRLIIVDNMNLEQAKTKEAVAKLGAHKLDNALLITDSVDKNLYLATRNLLNFNVRDVAATDPVSLVSYGHVMMTTAAVKAFEELLG